MSEGSHRIRIDKALEIGPNSSFEDGGHSGDKDLSRIM